MIAVHNAFDGDQRRRTVPSGQPYCRLRADVTIRLHALSGSVAMGGHRKVFLFQTLLSTRALDRRDGRRLRVRKLYTLDAATRRRGLIRLGGGLVALFVLLRATYLYGDPSEVVSADEAACSRCSRSSTSRSIRRRCSICA